MSKEEILEYAKLKSIGFMIWAVEKYSVDWEGFSLYEQEDGSTTILVKSKKIPIEDIYEQYLFSLNPSI